MNTILPTGAEGLHDGTIDVDTNTLKGILLDLHQTDTHLKPITGATNATPIVLTITGHGWTNGDLIFVDGVGGNLAANGVFKVANQAANTVELTRPDGTNVVGSGAYTSGGYAINLTQLKFLADISAGRVPSTTDQTIQNPTKALGVFDADNLTFSAVPGTVTAEAVLLYESTGAEATDRVLSLHTGRFIVTVNADAATSATSINVEPLPAGIASGQQLAFSNGVVATLSGAAVAGARSLSVNALSAGITAGHRALAKADVTNNFPITTNGGDVVIAWDNGAYRIYALVTF